MQGLSNVAQELLWVDPSPKEQQQTFAHINLKHDKQLSTYIKECLIELTRVVRASEQATLNELILLHATNTNLVQLLLV